MSKTGLLPAPKVIYEDEQWLVLDKPAHWLSIPGRGEAPNLVDWIQATRAKIWIVHRLDRETSGVILFAKSAESHRAACQAFEARETKKRYEFLAEGVCELPSFRVDTPIEGAPSLTLCERRQQGPSAWRGSAFPRTGRRHQIRIHLSQRGSPIVGDTQYGAPVREGVGRTLLHSAELTLPDGTRWVAPLPAEFMEQSELLVGKEARE